MVEHVPSKTPGNSFPAWLPVVEDDEAVIRMIIGRRSLRRGCWIGHSSTTKSRYQSQHFRIVWFCSLFALLSRLAAHSATSGADPGTKSRNNRHTELPINAPHGETRCFTADQMHLHPAMEIKVRHGETQSVLRNSKIRGNTYLQRQSEDKRTL